MKLVDGDIEQLGQRLDGVENALEGLTGNQSYKMVVEYIGITL